MLDLYRYFLNPFDDDAISLTELLRYTPAHLARLTSNHANGEFDALIAATDTLFTALGGKVSDEGVKLGIQIARTHAKEQFRRGLSNELSKVHGAVLGKHGRQSPVLRELFPLGLEGFSAADDPELGGRLEALAAAAGSRPELDADTKALATALATAWGGLYGEATTGKAGRGSAAEQRRAADRALRLQLFKNLLALAAQFPNQQEKADLYCPQHLLENRPSPEEPTQPPA